MSLGRFVIGASPRLCSAFFLSASLGHLCSRPGFPSCLIPLPALQGLGTPSPVAPPQHLVVSGLYRHVRNPMYVAVLSLICGQGLLFGSVRLLEYALVVWLGFLAFVVLYEEPALRKTFGQEYEDFCAHVPRWIPRLKPLEPRT